MRRSPADSLARTAALIAVGAFAVHQLRYLTGYGNAAGSELSRQGHDYLSGVLPVLAAFLLSAIAAGLLRAALARRTPSPGGGRAARFRDTYARRAALFTVVILIVFCAQESLEGVLSAGHPGGLAALFAHGGWIALPLAGLVAALCALLDRGFSALEAAIADGGAARRPRRPSAETSPPRQALLVPLSATPLAFGIARRPPPRPAF
jgi:hypothetical protein